MHIEIEPLNEGINRIRFDAPAASLASSMEEGVLSKPIHVEGVLSKTGTNLVLQAVISVDVTLACSRCLTDYTEHLTGNIDVLYRRTEPTQASFDLDKEDDLSSDIETLDYDAGTIDITRRVEEAIRLAMPMKPLCNEACRGLCPVCGIDLNHDTCACRVDRIDPRWQALRSAFQS